MIMAVACNKQGGDREITWDESPPPSFRTRKKKRGVKDGKKETKGAPRENDHLRKVTAPPF